MKAPSKNISRSLRGQSHGVSRTETVSVGRLRPADGTSMTIPGEGDVERPPGSVSGASAEVFAGGIGRHFGSSK